MKISGLADELKTFPIETVAHWWCQFNCFEWPADFPIPEPPDYAALKTLSSYEKYKNSSSGMVFLILSQFVPDKEQHRAWWVGGYAGPNNASNEKFEAWWASRKRL